MLVIAKVTKSRHVDTSKKYHIYKVVILGSQLIAKHTVSLSPVFEVITS